MTDKTERYQRQTQLPEVGATGQQLLEGARVLCVGAGGLGCPALLYLAAAGVGHISVMDFDVVEESNLQRQVLFTTEQLGQSKAVAAADRLRALNPHCTIEALPEPLTADNAVPAFQRADIIIDGTDNFASKYLINDTAVKTGKPVVYGSILGFEGQAALFNYQQGPCYRCLFPNPPQTHVANCAEAGTLGAVAGIVGTTQALQCIHVILGHESLQPLTEKLWTIDGRTMQTQLFSLAKDPHCPTCSQPDTIELTPSAVGTCHTIKDISAPLARKNTTAVFLDVREQQEWSSGHITGAHHFPLSALMDNQLPQLLPQQEIILYCGTGKRSQQAYEILTQQGFTHLYNLRGGYSQWLKK